MAQRLRHHSTQAARLSVLDFTQTPILFVSLAGPIGRLHIIPDFEAAVISHELFDAPAQLPVALFQRALTIVGGTKDVVTASSISHPDATSDEPTVAMSYNHIVTNAMPSVRSGVDHQVLPWCEQISVDLQQIIHRTVLGSIVVQDIARFEGYDKQQHPLADFIGFSERKHPKLAPISLSQLFHVDQATMPRRVADEVVIASMLFSAKDVLPLSCETKRGMHDCSLEFVKSSNDNESVTSSGTDADGMQLRTTSPLYLQLYLNSELVKQINSLDVRACASGSCFQVSNRIFKLGTLAVHLQPVPASHGVKDGLASAFQTKRSRHRSIEDYLLEIEYMDAGTSLEEKTIYVMEIPAFSIDLSGSTLPSQVTLMFSLRHYCAGPAFNACQGLAYLSHNFAFDSKYGKTFYEIQSQLSHDSVSFSPTSVFIPSSMPLELEARFPNVAGKAELPGSQTHFVYVATRPVATSSEDWQWQVQYFGDLARTEAATPFDLSYTIHQTNATWRISVPPMSFDRECRVLLIQSTHLTGGHNHDSTPPSHPAPGASSLPTVARLKGREWMRLCEAALLRFPAALLFAICLLRFEWTVVPKLVRSPVSLLFHSAVIVFIFSALLSQAAVILREFEYEYKLRITQIAAELKLHVNVLEHLPLASFAAMESSWPLKIVSVTALYLKSLLDGILSSYDFTASVALSNTIINHFTLVVLIFASYCIAKVLVTLLSVPTWFISRILSCALAQLSRLFQEKSDTAAPSISERIPRLFVVICAGWIELLCFCLYTDASLFTRSSALVLIIVSTPVFSCFIPDTPRHQVQRRLLLLTWTIGIFTVLPTLTRVPHSASQEIQRNHIEGDHASDLRLISSNWTLVPVETAQLKRATTDMIEYFVYRRYSILSMLSGNAVDLTVYTGFNFVASVICFVVTALSSLSLIHTPNLYLLNIRQQTARQVRFALLLIALLLVFPLKPLIYPLTYSPTLEHLPWLSILLSLLHICDFFDADPVDDSQ